MAQRPAPKPPDGRKDDGQAPDPGRDPREPSRPAPPKHLPRPTRR